MKTYLLITIITVLVITIIVVIILLNRKKKGNEDKKGNNNDNIDAVRYSCVQGKCVLDPKGMYTTNTCDHKCGINPSPSPKPTENPLPTKSPVPTKSPSPTTSPSPTPTPANSFSNMALTASPGTGITNVFPYRTTDVNIDWNEQGKGTWPLNKIPNIDFSDTIYRDFINASFKNRKIIPCSDLERSQFLSYLLGVFYSTNSDNLQKLTTDELRAFYRSLVFYYITTQKAQPDGGWYGDYWSNRIIDEGPVHNKYTGKINMSVYRNESFLFDSIMTNKVPNICDGYNKVNNVCPNHSKFFGNRLFTEMCQGTLRRGMRNSPQVLIENPPWAKTGKINSRYGTGGFPSDSFVECLQFPQEHGNEGWPSGCDSTKAKCFLKEKFESHPPLFQPNGKSRKNGGDPFCGLKSQWFYFSQGLGQFQNLGVTSYCYNYVDMFLNSPLGIGPNMSKNNKTNPVGWTSGFGPCTDKIGFPPGPGVLGYDINDPSKPTEHDYNDPAYSMKLILEYESRTDIPGPCKSNSKCNKGLRDPRTGMMGLGFCAPSHTGSSCPCDNEGVNVVNCLNSPEEKGGCAPSQPVNSRGDALNEQVAALMGLKKGTYWNPYILPGTSTYNLNSAKGIDGGNLNEYGGFDPTNQWKKVRVKNCKKTDYPIRNKNDFTKVLDNRMMSVGWINGHFYGYPIGEFIGDNKNTPNPFPEGIPGTDLKNNIIFGKYNTVDDPLIYYDMNGLELYRTWYGKPLSMDEPTALTLVAEFYSCGDTGFENFNTNWPFGSYFGYGQSLGGPGKSAAGALSCMPYGCTTVQFTSTPTAFGSLVQPAYDFEIMYLPPVNSTSDPGQCTCATSVTLDLTADFNTDNPGQDLKRYLCLNKGSGGGYVPRNSPAGQTAIAFQGQYMKVTNWTTVQGKNGSFEPTIKNKFNVNSDPQPLPFCKY